MNVLLRIYGIQDALCGNCRIYVYLCKFAGRLLSENYLTYAINFAQKVLYLLFVGIAGKSLEPDGKIIQSLNSEDYRTSTIRATGDHNALIIHPAAHNGTSLQAGIDISADGIPGF